MIERVVPVDQAVSHADDLVPRDFGVTSLEGFGEPGRGSANEFDQALAGALEQRSAANSGWVRPAKRTRASAQKSRICSRVSCGSRLLLADERVLLHRIPEAAAQATGGVQGHFARQQPGQSGLVGHEIQAGHVSAEVFDQDVHVAAGGVEVSPEHGAEQLRRRTPRVRQRAPSRSRSTGMGSSAMLMTGEWPRAGGRQVSEDDQFRARHRRCAGR